MWVTLANDRSDDRLISCFKKGKRCEWEKAMLENQLKFFNNSTLQDDPLIISDQDIVEAAPIFNIIDEDKDEVNIELHSYDSLSLISFG